MTELLEPKNGWEALVLTLSQLYSSRGEYIDPFDLAQQVRAVYKEWGDFNG